MRKEDLTQEKLKEILWYDELFGWFCWKHNKCKNKIKAGSRAGYINQRGYEYISINGINYRSNRLAWFYVYGYWPEHEVDHIDGNPSNNALYNLREVSHQCNMRNTRKSKRNTSGVTGITWDKKNKKWSAFIRKKDGNQTTIGRFKNFNDAVKARWKAEVKYDWPNCQTTSSAYLYLKENNLI